MSIYEVTDLYNGEVEYVDEFSYTYVGSAYKAAKLGVKVVPLNPQDTSVLVSYFLGGKLHRLDGPAFIKHDVSSWYNHGKYHRLDGPAVIYTNGTKSWYINGLRHRTDGPAIIRNDGYCFWYKRGILHRDGAPAVTSPDGYEQWYKNGICVNTSDKT